MRASPSPGYVWRRFCKGRAARTAGSRRDVLTWAATCRPGDRSHSALRPAGAAAAPRPSRGPAEGAAPIWPPRTKFTPREVVLRRPPKIQAWRSFSASTCDWSFNAQARASRRLVKDGSEFKFSLRSSNSLSSPDGSRHYSMLEPDVSRSSTTNVLPGIARHQGSTVSVQLRSPKSASGSVEYACTVSPPSTTNVLPGSPLRGPVLDTKVSTRVVTTTVSWTPPAHAIQPRRSSVSGMPSGEVPKTDKREGQHRRSVTFTNAPLMATVPESGVREVAVIDSTIPQSKSGPPQEQSELAVPKTMQPQSLEPRLGPPCGGSQGGSARVVGGCTA
ncbi:hypothetical protein MTO96_000351 [Rhipicephalus appendiculatus]